MQAPTSVEEFLGRYEAGERHFRGAKLRGALSGAFENVDLSDSDLSSLEFGTTHFENCEFSGADLSYSAWWEVWAEGCSFEGASLVGSDIWASVLLGCDLREVLLQSATLRGCDLIDCDCSGLTLGETAFVATNLSSLIDGQDNLWPLGSCYVDCRTVFESRDSPRLGEFLRRVGLPETVADAMILCARRSTPMQSTFISYGQPDEDFARRLYQELHANGVEVFFFPEHAVPGQRLHRVMRDGVNNHNRVILVCSEASLERRGVLNEIEETLAREARDGGTSYLIPIRLDDYVFAWTADVAQAVKDRVVADFRGADTDPAVFAGGVRRLLSALRKDEPVPPG